MMRFAASLAIAASLWTAAAQAALIIYYPLDEVGGNLANDAATADGAQNATSTNLAPNWQPTGGIVGGGLQFSPTGQTDVDEAFTYNTASTSTSLLSAPPFTITLWFNTTNTGAFNRAALYLGDSTKSDQYYAAGFDTTHHPQAVARNTTAINTAASATANDGQWHQLTAVFASPTSRTVYIDGRLAGSSTTSVPHMILNRFGLGALTRSTPTDAFAGLLDEIGLFDTAFSPQQSALLNAFPRYDAVRLDDPDYDLALSVFTNQTGSVTTGNWTWSYATGLSGGIGTTGLTGGNPYVVLDAQGNGLQAIPEPGSGVLALAGVLGLLRRRRAGA